MASKAEVERGIRSLMKALADASPDSGSVPDRTLLCVVPDLNAAYWMEMKDAKLDGLRPVSGAEHADVRITARSDDLVALMEGRLNVAFAFLTGKVRVDAAASDLMLLRKLF